MRRTMVFLAIVFCMVVCAQERGPWHFLPAFRHEIRGVESPEESFSRKAVPTPVERAVASAKPPSEAESGQMKWRPAVFPHTDFVSMMPQNRVFGWYACEFDVPEELSGRDLLVDLGIIDDSDETFLNGYLVGKTGRVPNGSAWQTDRLYRIPKEKLQPRGNYLASHVWSLWGLGGIVGPPILKAAVVPSSAQWEVAFVQDSVAPSADLNAARTAEKAISACFGGKAPAWQKASMPWRGYAGWREDVHNAVFRLRFQLPPGAITRAVVMDVGPVYDVAAFYLNGRRVGQTGRFPDGAGPAFTEAAERGRFIVTPEAWSADGQNELLAVVYRERGVGGLPGVPGFLLGGVPQGDCAGCPLHERLDALQVFLQSGRTEEFVRVLSAMGENTVEETSWKQSLQAQFAYLRWLDGGRTDDRLLEVVLASVSDMLRATPEIAPKQSAMQAFCGVLRHAEKNGRTLAEVRRFFPHFLDGCIRLSPDRKTEGDWFLFYGDTHYVLPAFGKAADYHGTADGGTFDYDVQTCAPKEKARYWQPNNAVAVADRNALLAMSPAMHTALETSKWIPDYLKSGVVCTGQKIRRAGWWDDHGEMHPFDDAGPDLRLAIRTTVRKDATLSFYLSDYDWRRTRHPRQQSLIIRDEKGQFLNACWTGKLDRGVYERFRFTSDQRPRIRFLKHRGACVAVSGVFVDTPMAMPDIAESVRKTQPEVVRVLEAFRRVEWENRMPFAAEECRHELENIQEVGECMTLMQLLREDKHLSYIWACLLVNRLETLAEPPLMPRETTELRSQKTANVISLRSAYLHRLYWDVVKRYEAMDAKQPVPRGASPQRETDNPQQRQQAEETRRVAEQKKRIEEAERKQQKATWSDKDEETLRGLMQDVMSAQEAFLLAHRAYKTNPTPENERNAQKKDKALAEKTKKLRAMQERRLAAGVTQPVTPKKVPPAAQPPAPKPVQSSAQSSPVEPQVIVTAESPAIQVAKEFITALNAGKEQEFMALFCEMDAKQTAYVKNWYEKMARFMQTKQMTLAVEEKAFVSGPAAIVPLRRTLTRNPAVFDIMRMCLVFRNGAWRLLPEVAYSGHDINGLHPEEGVGFSRIDQPFEKYAKEKMAPIREAQQRENKKIRQHKKEMPAEENHAN